MGDQKNEEEAAKIERQWKEFISQVIEWIVNSKDDEESINGAAIMCELTKDSSLFGFIQSPETIDKISLGLES